MKLILKVQGTKTPAAKRTIVLFDEMAEGTYAYLKPYLDSLPDENAVLFPYSYERYARIHKDLCKAAGIPREKWKFYQQRKRMLSHFYNTQGMVSAATMAGHRPGGNTMRYYCAVGESQLRQKPIPKIQQKKCPNPMCAKKGQGLPFHLTQCPECDAPLDSDAFGEIIKANLNELIDVKMQLFKAELRAMLLERKETIKKEKAL
ncbi:MAG: hypothetical protein V1494_04925 [Candidatus Diapherotrites archaeon]